ncbi:hypothetical protein TNCT_183621 [Trichonephila clavata]|uniref:DUF5641 domain-containing protein n=1 Tax=Trichonephila clavata TaxID=2740835 RepID=A0A8X6GWU2_TRICU|nr:hypothetical protein TNCT_183621 [Trichonephila clavata]
MTKEPIPRSLPSGPRTRKMTRTEAADDSQVLSGRSSPGPSQRAESNAESQVRFGRSSQFPYQGAASNIERQAMSEKSSLFPPRGAKDKDRQVLPGRSSPYQPRSRRHVIERQEPYRPLTVGDVVVLENNSKNRTLWSLARIIELIPGKDGHVRVVRVRTETGELVRPVQRLYNLEQLEPEINLPKEQTDSVIRTKSGRKVISPERLTYA